MTEIPRLSDSKRSRKARLLTLARREQRRLKLSNPRPERNLSYGT